MKEETISPFAFANEKIARFMGTRVENGWVYPVDGFIIRFGSGNLKYHKSWDELMPVCEKIKHIARDRDLEINGVFLHDEAKNRYAPIRAELGNVRIEAVYHCVIRFIDWYNEQTERK